MKKTIALAAIASLAYLFIAPLIELLATTTAAFAEKA